MLLIACSSDSEPDATAGTAPNPTPGDDAGALPSGAPEASRDAAADIVLDSFTGPAGDLEAHQGELGATWAPHPAYDAGIALTPDGTVYNGTNTKVYLASGAPQDAAYDVEVDLIIRTNQDHGGIVARADPESDSYYAAEGSPAQGTWQLRKRINGEWTLLDYCDVDLEAGRTYRLRLELRDESQKFYVDGALVAQATDDDPALAAPGSAGIRLSSDEYHPGDPSKGWQLDNFRVSAPAGEARGPTPPTGQESCGDTAGAPRPAEQQRELVLNGMWGRRIS